MCLKNIKKALSRIEGLMNAKPGTSEMDELELLTALVEMYEDQNYPISPPDPIEGMDQLGLTQKDMVSYIGTKSKVSAVLNGKRPLRIECPGAYYRVIKRGNNQEKIFKI